MAYCQASQDPACPHHPRSLTSDQTSYIIPPLVYALLSSVERNNACVQCHHNNYISCVWSIILYIIMLTLQMCTCIIMMGIIYYNLYICMHVI